MPRERRGSPALAVVGARRSLYFAYGSNMSSEVMRRACPGAARLGPARLDGYRLAFLRRSVLSDTGVADIAADADGQTWGVLYSLGEGERAALDHKEGLGWAYELLEVTVVSAEGPHAALTYTVKDKEPEEIEPSPEYLQRLLAAADENDLPEHYLARLAAIAERWLRVRAARTGGVAGAGEDG